MLFLQARLNSSRLPRKALLKLGDLTVIEHAMRALKKIRADSYILVTDHESLPVFKTYADEWGYGIFAGDPQDVLKRFHSAAQKYRPDFILRATGDNPLVSWELGNKLIEICLSRRIDYAGFLNIPAGTGIEMVRTEALRKAHLEARDPYDREHVCPYLYRNPKLFAIYRPRIDPPLAFPSGRITLDTDDDFRYLDLLFHDVYKGDAIGYDDLLAWLKTHDRPVRNDHVHVLPA